MLIADILAKVPGSRVVEAPPAVCADCGSTDALIYITTNYDEQFCGTCVRIGRQRAERAKQRGKGVEVEEQLNAPLASSPFERQLYRLHDEHGGGCIPIEPGEDIAKWQRKGFGIFWTVNKFKGTVRQNLQLDRILSWAVDLDQGTKREMRAKLHGAPLIPSLIVETKRGYHAYWNAKDAVEEHWPAIVEHRLVPYFDADKNAKDLARVLRAPGFLHLKDPKDPFLVSVVHKHDVAYTEAQMIARFPDATKETRESEEKTRVKYEARFEGSDDFWERVYRLNCTDALQRLSGHPAVNGERFTFKPVANGNQNILVDGKGTSCWVDRNGRIGSLSGGGPTIAQWLKWYGASYAEAAKIIKGLYPEIEKQ